MRFQDYCRSKGWQHDNGRWNITTISTACGKPANKVSDLLNGTGSFGALIAREIEAALGLPKHFLDGVEAWPFPGIEPQRFSALTYDQRLEIQGLVRERIERFEGERGKGTRRNGTLG